jgi:hypothetical protein
MTGIVILATQLGVVIGSFVGMSKVMSWYHKGGDNHGNTNSTIVKPRNRE